MTDSTDFSITVPVAAPAQDVRTASTRVEEWWTTAVERSGDEFTARFGHGWCRFRVDGSRWTVTAQDSPVLPIADEWVGDVLSFDVEETGTDTSTLTFTHHGLMTEECAAMCQSGWQHFVASLVALAETGAGNPSRPDLAAAGE
jgi:hypothetical protein